MKLRVSLYLCLPGKWFEMLLSLHLRATYAFYFYLADLISGTIYAFSKTGMDLISHISANVVCCNFEVENRRTKVLFLKTIRLSKNVLKLSFFAHNI